MHCLTDVIVDIKRKVRWAGQSENMVQITNAHICVGKPKGMRPLESHYSR